MPFAELVAALRAHYGTPKPLPKRDPLAWILYENVAYLVADEQRDLAFEQLRKRVGLTARALLGASPAALREVAERGGILAGGRMQKLLTIAELAEREFEGDLRPLLARPEREAIRALARFPSIGVPGAEKILLFCGAQPILALESNGLRVLLRVGYGQQQKHYAGSYRSVREALRPELPSTCPPLIEAHQLLRAHGRTLCKTTKPRCDACPLVRRCAYPRR
jgi:endonuclease-3